MNILGIKVSGFAMLSNDFTLDLRTKARVLASDKDDEVSSLANNLDVLRSYVFVGKNSSGKSTILRLIGLCYSFLSDGRFPFSRSISSKDDINLCIVFFHEGSVYKYSVRLLKPIKDISNIDSPASYLLKDESFLIREPFKNKKEDLFSKFHELEKPMEPLSKESEVSMIYPFLSGNNGYSLFASSPKRSVGLFSSVGWSSFFSLSSSLKESIVRLLDESIEKLDQTKDSSNYVFKRFGEPEMVLTPQELASILSDGTIRGAELFSDAILSLKKGKALIVDEIEGSFHKNLVENIIFPFNNVEINRNGATLIFSTHYSELLDSFRRRDGIFVCKKGEDGITVNNVFDYRLREELSKSNLFDNNAFGTLLNYDLLMKAKKEIIDEVSHNM